VIEKRSSCRRQFDAMYAPRQQGHADLIFEIANLPAEGRLRGVQPLLGGHRQAAFLGNGYEIPEMA
jgi:hypothetical protein